MPLVLHILLASTLQTAVGNALRLIHARSADVLLAVVCNYAVATLVALGYWVVVHPTGAGVSAAAAVGLPGGVFYAVALLAIVRSMGQRGLALTVAFAGLGQLVPSLVAILLGEALGLLPGAGLVVAAASLPLLSLRPTIRSSGPAGRRALPRSAPGSPASQAPGASSRRAANRSGPAGTRDSDRS